MLQRFLRWHARRQVDLSSVTSEYLRRKYVGADWSGKHLADFCPVGCVFEHCNFSNVIFEKVCFGGGLEDSLYRNCIFDRSTIRATAPGNARFENCSFRDIELLEFYAHNIAMVDNVFSGIVKRAFFNGTVSAEVQLALGRSRNDFHGNDFSGAEFVDVAFRTGIDLGRQRLPAGTHRE
jgi:uncharacterized protein YjbI with pentapeptide repeats